MAARITQETQGESGGRRQVTVRVMFDRAETDQDVVEVAATVRVPVVASDEQTESAARALAKRALEKALSALPL